jgi:hypothetical protein
MTAIFPYHYIFSKHGVLTHRTGFSNDFGRYHVEWRLLARLMFSMQATLFATDTLHFSFLMYGFVA